MLQVLGDVTAHDALCQTFDDGCFTHARLAYEDRVVLGAPAQYLQHAPDLFVTAYDRVEFAVACGIVEVDGVFAQ